MKFRHSGSAAQPLLVEFGLNKGAPMMILIDNPFDTLLNGKSEGNATFLYSYILDSI